MLSRRLAVTGIILDTEAIFEVLNAKVCPDSPVHRWMAGVERSRHQFWISEITLGEVYSSIYAIDQREIKKRKSMERTIARLRATAFRDSILPFDEPQIMEWANIRHIADAEGARLPTERAQILASAINFGYLCVTRIHPVHELLDVHVYDPWSQKAVNIDAEMSSIIA